MKYLNVAEKNDAAKTISGFLSNGTARMREGHSVYNKIYEFDTNIKGKNIKMVMTSVSGHLFNLDFFGVHRKWEHVDPLTLFHAPVHKNCSDANMPIKRTLEYEIRNCQSLVIWTDCDREGENIGFEIIDVCRAVKPNINIYRAIFSELTHTSVHRALDRLTKPNKLLSDAVDIRTELDLRSGAAITRFQTMRFQRLFPTKIADKLISYGNCQIPTLGFVAERYKEIESFVSESFWKLKVFHTIDDLTVEFKWARNRLFDKSACEDYLLMCLVDSNAKVERFNVKPKKKQRPTPLDTVEMEKLGVRKLKLSAKEILSIAEKLYTRGIISYPRTETNLFSKDMNLRELVERLTGHKTWGSFAQKIMEWGPNPRNGNKSDQAHPPIHPIKLVEDLRGDNARVYELICRHFLACVSKDAVGSETVVRINIAGEKFSATGLCIYEQNFLEVYSYEKWSEQRIHIYEFGEVFEPSEISMQENVTVAPALLSEADLIALMEKHGIGTDATHAEHINTVKERGYIGNVENGGLVPGIIGMGLYEGYDAMELVLAKPLLRAKFEMDLKDICSGKKDANTVLNEQIQEYTKAYRQITEKISVMDTKIAYRIKETPTSPTPANRCNSESKELFRCPQCETTSMTLRQTKTQNGYYIRCLNFPNCKNTIWLSEECKEPKVLIDSCHRCGPQTKLLKLKFNSGYYKNVFNTPLGWYKTCLRCDHQFREHFDINLDRVKRTGGINADETSARIMMLCNASNERLTMNCESQNFVCSGNTEIETAQINEEILHEFINNSSDSDHILKEAEDLTACIDINHVSNIPTATVTNTKPTLSAVNSPKNRRHDFNLTSNSDFGNDIIVHIRPKSNNFKKVLSGSSNIGSTSNHKNAECCELNRSNETGGKSLSMLRNIKSSTYPKTAKITIKKDGLNKDRQEAFWKKTSALMTSQSANESSPKTITDIQISDINCSHDIVVNCLKVNKEGQSKDRLLPNRERTKDKKRKCGLCRQEGHSRPKCHRKTD